MKFTFTRRNTAVGAIALAVGLLIGSTSGLMAAGSGMPANKATAAASKRIVMGPNGEYEILTAKMKTSKTTDLILQLTMECSIFTKLKTSSTTAGASSTAAATGTVKAWITIDDVVVPVTSVSSPPQDPPLAGDKETDSATMCNRTYQRTVTDTESDGQDTEDDFIETKNANGFNWLRQNAGSDEHVIKVWAKLDQNPTSGDTTARAHVGNRTLIIEPTKMANDAIIQESGSS